MNIPDLVKIALIIVILKKQGISSMMRLFKNWFFGNMSFVLSSSHFLVLFHDYFREIAHAHDLIDSRFIVQDFNV